MSAISQPAELEVFDLPPLEGDERARALALAVGVSQRLLGECRVFCVRATRKSQVFHVQSVKGEFALKLHAQPSAYATEALCYNVLAGSELAPRLVWHNARFGALLLEWLPSGEPVTDVVVGGFWLGALHGAMQRVLCESALPGLVRTRDLLAAWPKSTFTRLLTGAWTADHLCFAVGDVKSDHLLSHAGAARWIDFETFVSGHPQCADIVRLVDTSGAANLTRVDALALCEAYLRGYERHATTQLEPERLLRLVEAFVDDIWSSFRLNFWARH